MQLVPHILKIMEGTTTAKEKGFQKFNLGSIRNEGRDIPRKPGKAANMNYISSLQGYGIFWFIYNFYAGK